jgi:hypothetical protein
VVSTVCRLQAVALPLTYRRTAGPELDKSSKKSSERCCAEGGRTGQVRHLGRVACSAEGSADTDADCRVCPHRSDFTLLLKS